MRLTQQLSDLARKKEQTKELELKLRPNQVCKLHPASRLLIAPVLCAYLGRGNDDCTSSSKCSDNRFTYQAYQKPSFGDAYANTRPTLTYCQSCHANSKHNTHTNTQTHTHTHTHNYTHPLTHTRTREPMRICSSPAMKERHNASSMRVLHSTVSQLLGSGEQTPTPVLML